MILPATEAGWVGEGECLLNNHQKVLSKELYQLHYQASQVTLVVKNPPANAGDTREVGLVPGWGRSPGKGNGNTLQYSCLENPMDRGAWQVTVCWVAQSQTGLHLNYYTDEVHGYTHPSDQLLS